MILDYTYNKKLRELTVSYVTPNGGKALKNFNVDRFKTYYADPGGKFTNWDGSKCSEKWIQKPGMFEYKTFLEELPEETKKLFMGKTSPKLFTWDIETKIPEDNSEFPDPAEAKFEITNISIVSSDFNILVLGTREMNDEQKARLQQRVDEYFKQCKFYQQLDMQNKPYIKYILFDNEEEMLKYFLKGIVSKVAIIAGWNSILFDWQYIQNRINFYYPNISLNIASPNGQMSYKNFEDWKGNKIRLLMPSHTLVLDMMQVIQDHDMTVMPIKESMALDYIASESVGMHKIQYDGNLQQLYENDYETYVFYNAVDSILVQLIDKRFRTLQNICTQALYCKEKIGNCFSKIAISESLVFNDFYKHGIKIIENNDWSHGERGTLVGAYVKQPIPGKHKYICCNDFASLYPTGIITCNISYENIINKEFTEEELEKFRKDPNYFVSVNGNVYKNDKDYSFKRIQKQLKADRNVGKYLAKQLDAQVMSDIDHILKGFSQLVPKHREYAENMVNCMAEMGYDVKSSDDLLKWRADKEIGKLTKFKQELANEILFYTSYEQAMKLLGNSMYGGSSHQAFAWFNIKLANDITGEGRNLIHKMEHHIPEFWRDNWIKLTDVHNMLGIQIDVNKANEILKKHDSFVDMVYGDTDSLYISYENILNTIKDVDKMTIEQKRDIIVKLNVDFMDGHNAEYIDAYYKTRHAISAHKFELETLALSGVWLDVKKRYAQILLWKDGKIFDIDDLPMKVKGLEIIKSSYPKQSRAGLKRLVRLLLEESEDYLLQKLNIAMQKEKQLFYEADIEDICANAGVGAGKYTQYILDDTKEVLEVAKKCPVGPKALGNYNRIRNYYNLPGEPLYGGKIKMYDYYPGLKHKRANTQPFGFQASNYPKWADKYAPIAKECMFQKYTIDPFNRIIQHVVDGQLKINGEISLSLF